VGAAVPDRKYPAPLTPSPAIAQYRVAAKVSEGSMGEVYRATNLNREIVVSAFRAAALPSRLWSDRRGLGKRRFSTYESGCVLQSGARDRARSPRRLTSCRLPLKSATLAWSRITLLFEMLTTMLK